ncbi:MAG: hypothetical protein SVJ22_11035 [Halobacteriota archaeon]|nr:hypothetical protein [Halobacteriota archaeon]
MVDDSEESRIKYFAGLKRTFVPLAFGVLGGVLSSVFAGDFDDVVSFVVLLLMIGLQIPVYSFIDIEVKDFNQKDWVYVLAMTFLSWFVSWGVLLNL